MAKDQSVLLESILEAFLKSLFIRTIKSHHYDSK